MKNSKQRLVNVLEQDKEEMNEPTREAAKRDFSQLAEEYFEKEGDCKLEVKRAKGGYEVNLSFRAVRIKNFTSLK